MKDTSGARTWYHHDHLGSVRLRTDENGQEAETADFLPFGEPWSGSGGGESPAGHRTDSDSGFVYNVDPTGHFGEGGGFGGFLGSIFHIDFNGVGKKWKVTWNGPNPFGTVGGLGARAPGLANLARLMLGFGSGYGDHWGSGVLGVGFASPESRIGVGWAWGDGEGYIREALDWVLANVFGASRRARRRGPQQAAERARSNGGVPGCAAARLHPRRSSRGLLEGIRGPVGESAGRIPRMGSDQQ